MENAARYVQQKWHWFQTEGKNYKKKGKKGKKGKKAKADKAPPPADETPPPAAPVLKKVKAKAPPAPPVEEAAPALDVDSLKVADLKKELEARGIAQRTRCVGT